MIKKDDADLPLVDGKVHVYVMQFNKNFYFNEILLII